MATAEITGGSTMEEVLNAYAGAQRALMRGYHIGGCGNCGFSPSDRLSDVLATKNIHNVAEVIEFIKNSHEEEQRLQISPRDLTDELGGETPPRLIDVRGDEERAIAHIEGSQLASQELVQEMMTTWAKDTPIVTYCHHGIRSLEGASYFIGHGFTNVRSLTGGIHAWAEQIDESIAKY